MLQLIGLGLSRPNLKPLPKASVPAKDPAALRELDAQAMSVVIIPTSFHIVCFSRFSISSVHSQRNNMYSLSHEGGAVPSPPNMWV